MFIEATGLTDDLKKKKASGYHTTNIGMSTEICAILHGHIRHIKRFGLL